MALGLTVNSQSPASALLTLSTLLVVMLSSLTRTVCDYYPASWSSKADDRLDFMGGNSTKATSGINGALTRTQVDEKIADSVKQFYDDTLKSAREKARPDLIKVLTYKSAAAVEWLQDVFNLDLTLVSRLGYVQKLREWNRDNKVLTNILEATLTLEPTVATTQSSPAWPSHTRSCSASKSWQKRSPSAYRSSRRPRSTRSTQRETLLLV